MNTYLLLLHLLLILPCLSLAQEPFIFNYEQEFSDHIADIYEKNDSIIILQNRIYNFDLPGLFDYDSYADLVIIDQLGNVISIDSLNGPRTNYSNILELNDNKVYLVGAIKTDLCHFKIVVSVFDLISRQLTHLSQTDFCESTIVNIKIRHGLNDLKFIEETHYIDSSGQLKKEIHRIESDFSLTKVLNANVMFQTFSVDFSRKGYLISVVGLYNFYDADFSYRKQKFTNENHDLTLHQTHTPFGSNYILEQSVQRYFDLPDPGLQVRLIDSNLNIIQKLVILPPHYYASPASLPNSGGISIDNQNEIWAAAYYIHPPGFDSSFFTILKLNRTLGIQCQHFIGYDSYYRIHGIKAFNSGGAMVYGSRFRDGKTPNEDVYALRVGENCELPATVSTETLADSPPMISAYPNPGTNDLTFDVIGFDPASLHVELIDAQGKILFSTQDLSYSLQIPDMPAGQYFYRILQRDQLLGVGAWVKQ